MFHLHATNLSKVVLGVCGISGGIALVLSIIFGISLIITLLLSVATCIAIITLRFWSYDRYKRGLMKRQLLALAYKDKSAYEESLLHLNAALQNIGNIESKTMNHTIRNFEELITGRLSHKIKERIEKDILDLRSENQ